MGMRARVCVCACVCVWMCVCALVCIEAHMYKRDAWVRVEMGVCVGRRGGHRVNKMRAA
jgi:hypothetical protein